MYIRTYADYIIKRNKRNQGGGVVGDRNDVTSSVYRPPPIIIPLTGVRLHDAIQRVRTDFAGAPPNITAMIDAFELAHPITSSGAQIESLVHNIIGTLTGQNN